MHPIILQEMHKTTVYQNVVYNCHKFSFVPTVVNEWNALSKDVRESDSIRIFKEKIHVSVINQNDITCRTKPGFFFYVW